MILGGGQFAAMKLIEGIKLPRDKRRVVVPWPGNRGKDAFDDVNGGVVLLYLGVHEESFERGGSPVSRTAEDFQPASTQANPVDIQKDSIFTTRHSFPKAAAAHTLCGMVRRLRKWCACLRNFATEIAEKAVPEGIGPRRPAGIPPRLSRQSFSRKSAKPSAPSPAGVMSTDFRSSI